MSQTETVWDCCTSRTVMNRRIATLAGDTRPSQAFYFFIVNNPIDSIYLRSVYSMQVSTNKCPPFGLLPCPS